MVPRESFRPHGGSCLSRDVLDSEKGSIMPFYVKNVPAWERVVRVLAGAAAAVLAFQWLGGVAGMLAAAGAACFAVSGLVGFCPMCALFGRGRGKGAGR